MDNAVALHEFDTKFSKLSDQNQKYIIAIQQALLYAQETEYAENMNKDRKCTNKQLKHSGGLKNGF